MQFTTQLEGVGQPFLTKQAHRSLKDFLVSEHFTTSSNSASVQRNDTTPFTVLRKGTGLENNPSVQPNDLHSSFSSQGGGIYLGIESVLDGGVLPPACRIFRNWRPTLVGRSRLSQNSGHAGFDDYFRAFPSRSAHSPLLHRQQVVRRCHACRLTLHLAVGIPGKVRTIEHTKL